MTPFGVAVPTFPDPDGRMRVTHRPSWRITPVRLSHRRLASALAVGAALSLAASACGSSSLSGDTAGGSTSSAAPSGAADPALVAKLPAKIKAAGKIVVGVDATYAPNEFLGPDGKTVEGMDVDLFNAIAQAFGIKVEWQPAPFDSIILGVNSGKYDIGVSSFSVNSDREKVATMVSYFSAGTQWAAAKGNPKKIDPNNACGFNVAVQKATTQLDDVTAKSKKCTSSGKKKINIGVYADQGQATASVVSGKNDAMLADSPVGAYAVKQTGGKLQVIGQIYDSAPYGYVLPKAEADFAQAIVDSLKKLSASGAYKAALEKWGSGGGAITDFAVNPPVS
jgi:polar amino acid transport system substrate-binding protein